MSAWSVVERGELPADPSEASRRVATLVVRQARTYSADPIVQRIAARWAGLSLGARLAAAFEFVRDAIAFRPDPADVELIRGPRALFAERVGDCDDKAAALASLLRALAVRCRVVLARTDRTDPGYLSHVYVEAWGPRGWVALDPTFPGTPLGYSPRQFGAPLRFEV